MPQIYTVEQTQSVLGNFHYRDKLKASKQKSLDFHFKNPLSLIPNFAAEHMIIITVVSIQQLIPSLLLTAMSDINKSKIKMINKKTANSFINHSIVDVVGGCSGEGGSYERNCSCQRYVNGFSMPNTPCIPVSGQEVKSDWY